MALFLFFYHIDQLTKLVKYSNISSVYKKSFRINVDFNIITTRVSFDIRFKMKTILVTLAVLAVATTAIEGKHIKESIRINLEEKQEKIV